MNNRIALIAWSSVTISSFILIGFVIYVSGALWPLWFLILPFSVSIKSGNDSEEDT